VLVLTAVATVAFDLIVAVEIGVAVAALLALRAVARNASATAEPVAANAPGLRADGVTPDEEQELLSEHILTYRLDGALFFGAAQRFLSELTAVHGVQVVILRFPDLQVLDATGAQALGEIVAQLEARGITVLLKGPRPEHLKVLAAVGVLDRLAHERHLFDDLDAAVAHARLHVARSEHAA
jgi:SulP family sulfate permease